MQLREQEFKAIANYREVFPVVALVGPRQCGKTTLARQLGAAHHFDLEDPRDLEALRNPMLALESLEGLVVLDEIQRMPELFPALRVLVDQDPNFQRRQFVILGSASPDLLLRGSETLAGRIGFLEMGGFRLSDVSPDRMHDLWFRGGLPRAFLARSNQAATLWLENYIRTFVERDLPQLGLPLAPAQTRQFWTMLAHNHGSILNLAELGTVVRVQRGHGQEVRGPIAGRDGHPTPAAVAREYAKRLVQRPKVYLRDCGRAASAPGDRDPRPVGAGTSSWGRRGRAFALEQVVRSLPATVRDVHFWATHSGAELDLLWETGGARFGVEFKYGDAPKLTRSMRSALDDLGLGAPFGWWCRPVGATV